MAIKQRPVAKNQHGAAAILNLEKLMFLHFLTTFNEIQ